MEVSLSEKCFHDFLQLVHELTGITIATNRTSMIEGRLRKRINALHLSSYESYLMLVKENRVEQALFINLITTNETYFFRTPRIWDYIENKLLPTWHAAHPKKVFTAWSAAASSGEEAHSLGVMCQAFKETHPTFLFQVLGTDISTEMVGLCQAGRYTGRSIEAFRKTKPQLFEKYMKKNDDGSFEVIPEIKNRLRFQAHNLFRSYPTKDRFDLILVRNVLIYFKNNDQEKVLSLIAPMTAEDGIVIIGESESLSHLHTAFKQLEPLVYRLDSATSTTSKAG